VTLFDAYALVALVGDEPAAQEVNDLLRAGNSAINAINQAVVDVAREEGIALIPLVDSSGRNPD
jgi:hypothetical protein